MKKTGDKLSCLFIVSLFIFCQCASRSNSAELSLSPSQSEWQPQLSQKAPEPETPSAQSTNTIVLIDKSGFQTVKIIPQISNPSSEPSKESSRERQEGTALEIPFLSCVEKETVMQNERLLLTLLKGTSNHQILEWKAYGLVDGITLEVYHLTANFAQNSRELSFKVRSKNLTGPVFSSEKDHGMEKIIVTFKENIGNPSLTLEFRDSLKTQENPKENSTLHFNSCLFMGKWRIEQTKAK